MKSEKIDRDCLPVADTEHQRQRPGLTVLLCAALAILGQHHLSLAAAAANVTPMYTRDVAAETVMKIKAPFTVAAVGDIIMPQPLKRTGPGFEKLIDRMRKADVGFANMESSLVDFRNFKSAVYGTLAPLEMGESLKAMGITMMNHANNHAMDGGVEGMFSTIEALDKLGIVHAGSGRYLQDARSARYLETSKGRVGVIGMFSVDDVSNYGPRYDKTLATYKNGLLGGAPGVNGLRLTAYHIVSPQDLQTIKKLAASTYGQQENAVVSTRSGDTERFKFYDKWYQTGSDPGAVNYEINPNDLKDILASVRDGKIYADFMIVNIHSHHTTRFRALDTMAMTKEGQEPETPDFLVKLAHACIDNGADMFVAHGPHSLRGVEIYKGKPIYYGVSNFVFQFGLQFGVNSDILASVNERSELQNPASQEALLATSHYDGGKLKEVRLYPAELGGINRPISQMGIPMTPGSEEAQRILKAVQEYSQPFGTNIAIEDNVGVIRIGPDGRSIAKGR